MDNDAQAYDSSHFITTTIVSSGTRTCPTCNGTGINPVRTDLLCPKCHGEKQVAAPIQYPSYPQYPAYPTHPVQPWWSPGYPSRPDIIC